MACGSISTPIDRTKRDPTSVPLLPKSGRGTISCQNINLADMRDSVINNGFLSILLDHLKKHSNSRFWYGVERHSALITFLDLEPYFFLIIIHAFRHDSLRCVCSRSSSSRHKGYGSSQLVCNKICGFQALPYPALKRPRRDPAYQLHSPVMQIQIVNNTKDL